MTLFFLSFIAFAETSTCPAGNLKVCQEYLKKEHAINQDEKFAEKYNAVCNVNPAFSCIKMTVRDDVDKVMKEQAELRGPKAALYNIRIDKEDYIYILNQKKK